MVDTCSSSNELRNSGHWKRWFKVVIELSLIDLRDIDLRLDEICFYRISIIAVKAFIRSSATKKQQLLWQQANEERIVEQAAPTI